MGLATSSTGSLTRSGFFRKILKKLPHKEAQMSDEGEVTPTQAPSRIGRNSGAVPLGFFKVGMS